MRPSTKQRCGIHTLKRGNCRASATVDHHPASSPPSLPLPATPARECLASWSRQSCLHWEPQRSRPLLQPFITRKTPSSTSDKSRVMGGEWSRSEREKIEGCSKFWKLRMLLTANTVLIKYLYHNSAFFNSICLITQTTQMQIKTSH